jgi:carbonic anhydrase
MLRNRILRYIAILSVGTTALAACGGGGVVITVKAVEAYRLADAVVVRAYAKTPEPAAADLRKAFDTEKLKTSLPEHWRMEDISEEMLEVQLWVPDSEAAGVEGEAVEGHADESVESTTTAADTAVDASSTSVPESTTTVVQKLALASCIALHKGEWEAHPEPCERPEHAEDAGHGAEDSHDTGAAEAGHVAWGYDAETGPSHWADMDTSYETCAAGKSQSPIDITKSVKRELTDPAISYSVGVATVVNTGHTIQASAAAGNTTRIEGIEYQLANLHYHSPSEHTVEGKHAAAEAHFVHKDAAENIAVIGVMIIEGKKDNAAWKPFIDSLNIKEGASFETTVDWQAMLPSSLGSYRYSGSLTTPPCTEGVSWVVLESPVELSATQITALEGAYNHNARPVQGINGRTSSADSADK